MRMGESLDSALRRYHFIELATNNVQHFETRWSAFFVEDRTAGNAAAPVAGMFYLQHTFAIRALFRLSFRLCRNCALERSRRPRIGDLHAGKGFLPTVEMTNGVISTVGRNLPCHASCNALLRQNLLFGCLWASDTRSGTQSTRSFPLGAG